MPSRSVVLIAFQSITEDKVKTMKHDPEVGFSYAVHFLVKHTQLKSAVDKIPVIINVFHKL